MDHHEWLIDRQRRPSQPGLGSLQQPEMSEGQPEDYTTLPQSRFSGFKTGKSDERRLEDPFARQTVVEPVARETRTPSPLRGSITPAGYQRKTNLSSGRPNGGTHVAFLAARPNGHNGGQYSGSSTPKAGSALSPPSKAAKLSSVKDRVAMFERPSEAVSRIPYRPISRTDPAPRTPTSPSPQTTIRRESAVSKVLQPQVGQRNTLTKANRSSPRKPKQAASTQSSAQDQSSNTAPSNTISSNDRASKSMHNLANSPITPSQQQPLFGETFSPGSGPGYGIPSPRRRGSEGSTMRVPSGMFTDEDGTSMGMAKPRSRKASIDSSQQTTRPDAHRRAQSDHSYDQPGVENFDLEVPKPWMSIEQTNQRPEPNGSAKKAASKIPIRSRANSQASDYSVASTSPTSVTARGQYPQRASTPRKGNRSNDSGGIVSPSRNRGAMSPLNARSPGGRPQHTDGSQLAANIIAPPPKVSPPLRSSRPRLPVSTASTAASRAKANEKSQQASPLESSSKGRTRLTKRLPGLENVDLEARRRQIISKTALEKARQDELAVERLRIARERDEKLQRQQKLKEAEQSDGDKSSIIEDTPSGDDADHEEFETPTEEAPKLEPTLTLDTTNVSLSHAQHHPVYRVSSPADVDSPTLGDTSRMSVLRSGSHLAPGLAPNSAVSHDTEHTPIDTEPQVDLPNQEKHERTVLSQILQMRAPSYLSTAHSESRRFDDDSQSDKESVQIMLRNTAVFPESARMEPLQEDNGQAVTADVTPSTDSWTSSLEDPSPVDVVQEQQAAYKRPLQGLAALSNAVASASKSSSPALSQGVFKPNESRVNELGGRMQQYARYELPRSNFESAFPDSDSGSTRPASRDGWDSRRVSEDSRGSQMEENDRSEAVNAGIALVDAKAGNERDDRGFDQSNSDFLSSSCSSADFEPNQQPQTPEDDNQRPQYRASLTRREDFESASPSFIHWSRFVAQEGSNDTSTDEDEDEGKPHPPPKDEEELSDRATTPRATTTSTLPSIDSLTQGLGVQIRVDSPSKTVSSSYDTSPPVPTHSPPPVPMGQIFSTPRQKSPPYQQRAFPRATLEQRSYSDIPPRMASSVSLLNSQDSFQADPASISGTSFSTYQSTSSRQPLLRSDRPSNDSSRDLSVIQENHTATNVRSLGTRTSNETASAIPFNDERTSSGSRNSMILSENRPSTDVATSRISSPTAEQKRLSRRKHIIKELIDTEWSYGNDIKVVVDIYKATAVEAGQLSKDDARILFANIEDVLQFSQDFFQELKVAAQPVYKMSNKHRKGDRNSKVTTQTGQTDDGSSFQHGPELSDIKRDNMTTIGEAFMKYLRRMEDVYMVYVRSNESSVKKLTELQAQQSTLTWLKECANESSDLTTAWDLGSLLVKPVQRFLKYPLLLSELANATYWDHSDIWKIKESLNGVKDLSLRINERKKHAEMVREIVAPAPGKKRKESGIATKLTQAFGRRTEKLKQQIGLSDYIEDAAYDLVKVAHMENKTKFAFFKRDFAGHLVAVEAAMNLFNNYLTEIEHWVTISDLHRDGPQVRNKWLLARNVMRDLQTIGLPSYVNSLQQQVLSPIEQTIKAHEALENGIMAQRETRNFDYSKYQNAVNKRNGKIDKRTEALAEEWMALNKEAKERMGKLMVASNQLVSLLLAKFVKCNREWWQIWRNKFQFIVEGDPVGNLRTNMQDFETTLTRDWRDEHGIPEANLLSLGLVNGSYLLETANMFTFPSDSPSLAGDDSPRHNSVTDANRQGSGSFANFSQAYSAKRPAMTELSRNESPFFPGRVRASSTTTTTNSSMAAVAGTTRPMSIDTSTADRRPATSDEPSPHLPRLSLDAPSPSFQVNFVNDANNVNNRSPNRSTPRSPGDRFSGLFSSAMPLTDSPRAQTPQSTGGSGTPNVLFLAASVYEFNIDKSRREAGYPYLTYTAGEVFDVIGEKGELWLARNQDDPAGLIGWIWNKHFVKLAA